MDEDRENRLMRRRGEITERIRQLQEREHELADGDLRGSTPQDVARAREHAEEAHGHARVAHEDASASHEEAAAAHLRTAEVLAEHGRATEAAAHRRAAEAEREARARAEQAADEHR